MANASLPHADINECDVEGSCHDNANCTDVPGSFTCLCLPGYTGDGFNICTGRILSTRSLICTHFHTTKILN